MQCIFEDIDLIILIISECVFTSPLVVSSSSIAYSMIHLESFTAIMVDVDFTQTVLS